MTKFRNIVTKRIGHRSQDPSAEREEERGRRREREKMARERERKRESDVMRKNSYKGDREEETCWYCVYPN